MYALPEQVTPSNRTSSESRCTIGDESRLAIASGDREFALDIKNVLAEVCQRGYADRAAIWNEHHLNKPPTARGKPQNPQIHSQKFEEIKKPAMSLTTFSPGLEKLCTPTAPTRHPRLEWSSRHIYRTEAAT